MRLAFDFDAWLDQIERDYYRDAQPTEREENLQKEIEVLKVEAKEMRDLIERLEERVTQLKEILQGKPAQRDLSKPTRSCCISGITDEDKEKFRDYFRKLL